MSEFIILGAKADPAKLTLARELIEKGWTQYAYARDMAGEKTSSQDNPDAILFSAEGALKAVTHSAFSPERSALEVAVGMPLAKWNDEPGRTKEDVLAAYDVVLAFHGASI